MPSSKRFHGWTNRRSRRLGTSLADILPEQRWGALGVEDDGGGDVAIFGDEDIEGATQGTVIHYLEAYALFAEQREYFRIREHLAHTGT